MKRILLATLAASFVAGGAQAQNLKLTMTAGGIGGATDIAARNLAEVASANKIATIQVQVGKTLTKTLRDVAEGKTNITAGANVLPFLMSRGLGPYSGLGKENGKEARGQPPYALPLSFGFHVPCRLPKYRDRQLRETEGQGRT